MTSRSDIPSSSFHLVYFCLCLFHHLHVNPEWEWIYLNPKCKQRANPHDARTELFGSARQAPSYAYCKRFGSRLVPHFHLRFGMPHQRTYTDNLLIWLRRFIHLRGGKKSSSREFTNPGIPGTNLQANTLKHTHWCWFVICKTTCSKVTSLAERVAYGTCRIVLRTGALACNINCFVYILKAMYCL